MELFTIGNYSVSLIDVIVAAVCLLVLILFLIFIIRDIKKKSRLAKSDEVPVTTNNAADFSAAKDTTGKSSKEIRKVEKASKKKQIKKETRIKREPKSIRWSNCSDSIRMRPSKTRIVK